MSVPSPPANTMLPPSGLKRPRPSSSNLSNTSIPGVPLAGSSLGTGGPATGAGSRAKRRKPESAVDEKKEAEGEIKTRINFNDLPLETLYKYLEAHDLLPRWDPSPWSEEPCMPPNMLYANLPHALGPNTFEQEYGALDPSTPVGSIPPISNAVLEDTKPVIAGSDAIENGSGPKTEMASTALVEEANVNGDTKLLQTENGVGAPNNSTDPANEFPPTNDPIACTRSPSPSLVEPPTTRSKTAPSRRPPTPSPPIPSPIHRGVITLSDVLEAKRVLAEKANSHWAKGLGGGQNKEGETIVNFLYKMKVGPGRLLRVYNPTTAAQPPWL
ncbi:hypothetical protein L204_101039 [Cryptococcus depauperatus]|nr:hypothetical protein L204_01032 [Cryptococcus depauperatus CBS 7855]